MNGQFQPKYVGTFRKVDAGMVIAAGKPFLFFFTQLYLTKWKNITCIQISFAHSIFSTTRYLHVLQPEDDTAVSGRRSSVPTVSSSSVACTPPDRRGSGPALLQAEVISRQECSRSEFVDNISNPQHNIGHLAADIAEEQSQGNRRFHGWNWLWPAFFRTWLTFSLQALTLISVLLGNWTSTQKLLRHVMEEMSRFA